MALLVRTKANLSFDESRGFILVEFPELKGVLSINKSWVMNWERPFNLLKSKIDNGETQLQGSFLVDSVVSNGAKYKYWLKVLNYFDNTSKEEIRNGENQEELQEEPIPY